MYRWLLAIILLTVALVSGAIYLAVRPTELTVAVSVDDQIDRQVIETTATALRDRRSPVRLALKVKASAAAVSTAVETGHADLGVLRSDVANPSGAEAVLILRREAFVIVAPAAAKVKKIGDLSGKRIGIVRHGSRAGNGLHALLDYYGLATDKGSLAFIDANELHDALQEKRFDVFVLSGSPTAAPVSSSVRRIAKAFPGELTFIDVSEAEAISKRVPDVEMIEISEGTFGGRPPLPKEELTTIGSPVRLIARARLNDEPVSLLVEQMLALRPMLSRVTPGVETMETPDPDNSAMLVQAGVRAFRDGEVKTFLERYSDFIYLGLFVTGGVGSAFTALSARLALRKRQSAMSILRDLRMALDNLPKHPSEAELDELEAHIADVYRSAVDWAAKCDLSSDDIAAFALALAHAREEVSLLRARAVRPPPRPLGTLDVVSSAVDKPDAVNRSILSR